MTLCDGGEEVPALMSRLLGCGSASQARGGTIH